MSSSSVVCLPRHVGLWDWVNILRMLTQSQCLCSSASRAFCSICSLHSSRRCFLSSLFRLCCFLDWASSLWYCSSKAFQCSVNVSNAASSLSSYIFVDSVPSRTSEFSSQPISSALSLSKASLSQVSLPNHRSFFKFRIVSSSESVQKSWPTWDRLFNSFT